MFEYLWWFRRNNPGVFSIIPILAVLYPVRVNASIVLLWGVLDCPNFGCFVSSRFQHCHCIAVRNSIKAGMNCHKIQEIEHTQEKLNQGGHELAQNLGNRAHPSATSRVKIFISTYNPWSFAIVSFKNKIFYHINIYLAWGGASSSEQVLTSLWSWPPCLMYMSREGACTVSSNHNGHMGPPALNRMTDTYKNITFPQLRWPAV